MRRPPSDFGRQTIPSHLVAAFRGSPDHKNVLINFYLSLQVHFGTGIARRVCIGIDAKTWFTNNNWPSNERVLLLQPSSLL